MEFFLLLLCIASAALSIWVYYLISREFYRAAVMKGHTEKKYLWLPFFLGIIGYLLVIALPNKNAVSVAQSANDELPEL